MSDTIIISLVALQVVLCAIYLAFKISLTFRLMVEISTQVSLWLDGIQTPFDWQYVLYNRREQI